MGGPVNKAAYVTGTAILTEAHAAGVGTETYNFGTNFMAAVSAACIVPPLITTFAVAVGKKYFSQEDHDAGIVNFILGCTHITEGAIPLMTKSIWPVMLIMMIGSSVASIPSLMFGVHDPAPHGGFLVLPVVENAPMWVLAIAIGTVVGGILFVAFKKREWTKAQKAAEVEVEKAEAAAIDAEAEQAAEEGFVKTSNVFCDQKVDGRDAALSFIAECAVSAGIADDSTALYAAFLKREAEGTTGMVDGFAIPHAKTDTVKAASVMVLKAPAGIAFWEILDGAPVTCAIALLVPESEAGSAHLQILSKVATALTDEAFHAACKAEDDPAKVAGLINERLA